MVIAIDGPAGSGKSTIAGLLAKKLTGKDGQRFSYINSGNLYRTITFGCIRAKIDLNNSEKVIEFAKSIKITCKKTQVFLDGEDVTPLLHTDEIDKYSAPLSAIVPVRHIINGIIRSLAEGRNIIVEGRDMTTVVFPDTPYRFYLDACADSRVKRRYDQKVSNLSLDEIRTAIFHRDEIDMNKIEGSLKIADGVQYLDTSDLTIMQVYDKLIERIENNKE
jgi:cytidylate kinase